MLIYEPAAHGRACAAASQTQQAAIMWGTSVCETVSTTVVDAYMVARERSRTPEEAAKDAALHMEGLVSV